MMVGYLTDWVLVNDSVACAQRGGDTSTRTLTAPDKCLLNGVIYGMASPAAQAA